MHDGADRQVEAGSPECLAVKGVVTDFSALVEKDGAFSLSAASPLFKPAWPRLSERRRRIPFDHEQHPLDAAEFAERSGQLAGF